MSGSHARPIDGRRLTSVVALTLLTVGLMGNAASLGAACPAIYPADAACGTGARSIWLLVGVTIAVACLALVMVGEFAGRRAASSPSLPRLGMIRWGAAGLAGSAVLFPLAIAYSGSFVIDERGILLAGVTAVMCIVLATYVARTPPIPRDRSGPIEDHVS